MSSRYAASSNRTREIERRGTSRRKIANAFGIASIVAEGLRLQVLFPWESSDTQVEVDAIPEVHYRCPSCIQLTMKLAKRDCWD